MFSPRYALSSDDTLFSEQIWRLSKVENVCLFKKIIGKMKQKLYDCSAINSIILFYSCHHSYFHFFLSIPCSMRWFFDVFWIFVPSSSSSYSSFSPYINLMPMKEKLIKVKRNIIIRNGNSSSIGHKVKYFKWRKRTNPYVHELPQQKTINRMKKKKNQIV